MTAQEICLLLMRGFVPKENLRVLDIDYDLRGEVVERLLSVGIEFVDHPRTDYYGVRPLEKISSMDDIIKDWNVAITKGLNLKTITKGLLVVLWGFLVFPTLMNDGYNNRTYAIGFEELYQNYKEKLTKTALTQILTQLKKYRFIEMSGGNYIAGPGLYIYLDQDEIYHRFSDSVIKFKVQQIRDKSKQFQANATSKTEEDTKIDTVS